MRRTKPRKNSQIALSGIMGLLCAEQHVGNLKKCTFRNSGTPVRRTKRRTSQDMHFQEFWDSCAQNKTSEISNNGLSRILGLLCANVGNLKKWIVRNSGTPVRRTRRRKSQQIGFQEFWDSCAMNIAAARAVDREFNYKFGSDAGVGRRGGCATPHPPAFPGCSAPRTPQKALRALGCSGCSLSRDRATCPGQLRCLGQGSSSLRQGSSSATCIPLRQILIV